MAGGEIAPTKKMALIELDIKNEDEKCRRKALRFAVSTPNVEAAGLTGVDRNHVIIVGNDLLNWGELAVKMKKKIGAKTNLLWIEDIDWAGLTGSMRYIGSTTSGSNVGTASSSGSARLTVSMGYIDGTTSGSNVGTASRSSGGAGNGCTIL